MLEEKSARKILELAVIGINRDHPSRNVRCNYHSFRDIFFMLCVNCFQFFHIISTSGFRWASKRSPDFEHYKAYISKVHFLFGTNASYLRKCDLLSSSRCKLRDDCEKCKKGDNCERSKSRRHQYCRRATQYLYEIFLE